MAFPMNRVAPSARSRGVLAIPPGLEAFARELGLDPATIGHLDRTQRIGIALARLVDPVLAARPETAWGFYLHDVGKAGISSELLTKPGPLSDEEWVVMRAHPEIGARLLAPIPELAGAIEIVRCHHERWDGNGYPAGLGGRRIPLGARIFALADSFDAMTRDRPYRKARSTKFALDEIRQGAGGQFDPAVVEAFLSLVEGAGLPDPGAVLSLHVARAV